MSDMFKSTDAIVKQFFEHPAFNRPKSMLVYCDYIATVISKELKANDSERLLSSVGRPQFDLTESGAFKSTTKTIEVEDRFGRKYRVTVEEVA